MRTLTTALASSLLALSAASVADAQTYLRVTGSTAFRAATHSAMGNILNAGYTVGYSGTSLPGASQAVFTGTLKNGGMSVIIKTSWSGSVGGVQTTTKGLVPTAGWLADGLNGSGQTTIEPGSNPPDASMSDGFQSSTTYTTPLLNDNIVGVVAFKWVRENLTGTSYNGLTNVTPQLAQALFLNGTVPVALFTGNSADEGTIIFATGRDPDSGTRLTAFAETGVGVQTAVVQYQPTITGGQITAIAPWPDITVNGTLIPSPQGGYSGGGAVATALTKTPAFSYSINGTAYSGYFISYLGVNDAANAIAGGATELTYNGVSFSTAAIQNGQYTFWGYEHLLSKKTLSTNQKTIVTQLANQISTTDAAVSGLLLGNMRVSRPGDGGLVTATYF